MTIRCFKKEERFSQENINRVDASLTMDFHNNGSNEWMGFRLELIGIFVLCIAALLMVMLPSSIIKPGKFLFIYYEHLYPTLCSYADIVLFIM